jgi:GNAT superfamily N-acetyltransferase
LGILEAQRSALPGSAIVLYRQGIIEEWASASIGPKQVEDFAQWIRRGEESIVVAVEHSGGIIGFGAIEPKKSELRAVYVTAKHGRRGIGRALLGQLEDKARNAGLTALRMNASINAVRFYEANGFISLGCGVHTMPYGRRMPYVRMQKNL